MAAKAPGKDKVLAAFFDDGAWTPLYPDGAVSAAYGCANGQSVYAVWQNGEALDVRDLQKQIHIIKLAGQTGSPVVTFYNSVGAKLEGGLDLLKTNARLMAASARLSGVVPQVAVVIGVCGGSAAVQAASADVCIMAEDTGELFLTAPFNDPEAPADAGKAAAAARAGVAAVVAKDAAAAAKQAAKLVGMLPGNNLAGPALFDFAAPDTAFAPSAAPAKQAEAIADANSAVELWSGYGKNVYTALACVQGSVVGILATAPEGLCRKCVAKAARFVRLCDAYSIPVVTVAGTAGFGGSAADDVAGGIRPAARLAAVYAEATTVKVAVLAGQVIGPVYTALAASADWRVAVQGCCVAPLAPNAAVSVLYKDEIEASDSIQKTTAAKAAAYASEVCGAAPAVAAGVADAVAVPTAVRAQVAQALDMLAAKRTERLPKKHGATAL